MGVILRIRSKIWGATPHKNLGGPNPNVVNQSRRTWPKLILGIGRENEYPKLISPPKKFQGGQSLENSTLKLALLRGRRSHALQIFTSGSGSWCLTYVPLGGASPQKKFGGGAKFFPTPLGSGGMVQTFPGNSPWKEVPKTGFKIFGAPPKKFVGGGQN